MGFALPGIAVALALVFFGANYALPLYQTVGLLLLAYVGALVYTFGIKQERAAQELKSGANVLFYVSYWLISKIETAKWQKYITGKMQEAVSTGSAFTLGMVAFLSVYREGFETVLFYKALYLYAGNQAAGIIPGFLVGCMILAVVFYLINQLGVKIPINMKAMK